MKCRICLVYSVLSYALFLLTTVYAIAFFGNIYVARTIDSVAVVPLGEALLINLLLLLAFGLQHSGMARPAFKRWLTRLIPQAAERSTYVLTSSIAVIAMMALWQPMGGLVWQIDDPVAMTAIRAVYFAGWGVMITATYLIDHWELFGLRQVNAYCRGRDYTPKPFAVPALYRIVRHPIYLGWLLILWASPVMTVTHLVAALGLTIYILVGIRLEERDLVREFRCYRQYRRKVPMLIPSTTRRLDPEHEPCS
jgi:protein-S-isoprenylcysteine O-methyltransferase Ste14